MRKTKYKVWDKSENDWCEDKVALLPNGKVTYGEWPGGGLAEKDGEDLVWLQYTGLKDKNGKEIYDGDVITYNQEDPRYFGPITYEVVYAGKSGLAGFCLRSIQRNELYLSALEVNEKTTIYVIGNIYETPELLTNKQK